MRVLAVDGAADGLCRAEDLLHGASHLARHRARTHDLGSLNDVLHRDVAVVLDCGQGERRKTPGGEETNK